MNPILKNVLAVVTGIIVGMVVNMGIIQLSGSIIPLPEGIDPSNADSLKENIHLLQAKHFIMPFLAHALGTLAGAYTVARLAATHHMKFALGIGAFFLLGGLAAIQMIGGPLWFNILDIVGAYIPMGWLGGRLAQGKGLA